MLKCWIFSLCILWIYARYVSGLADSVLLSLDPSLKLITPFAYQSVCKDEFDSECKEGSSLLEFDSPFVHIHNFVHGAPSFHGFVDVLHQAYASHATLVLHPSDFHLLIWQGLGSYIASHAEQLRPFFVNFQDQ